MCQVEKYLVLFLSKFIVVLLTHTVLECIYLKWLCTYLSNRN